MDPSLLPQFGVAGALVIVVGYLLTANHRLMSATRSDRAEYLKALAARETAHADEITALRNRVTGLETASPSWKTNSTANATAAAKQRTSPPPCDATPDPPTPPSERPSPIR